MQVKLDFILIQMLELDLSQLLIGFLEAKLDSFFVFVMLDGDNDSIWDDDVEISEVLIDSHVLILIQVKLIIRVFDLEHLL